MANAFPGQATDVNGTGSDGQATFALGTRGSALALHQAEAVATLVSVAHPGLTVQVKKVSSEGDIDKSTPLTQIGGRGVFTTALQQALTLGQIDAAVHSSKDVPSLSAPGLSIAAFPQREDPRDAVISRHGLGLADLPPQPVVGTSSRRRAVQVMALRPDARIIDLRGNIDTRLRKATAEPYDAVILAAAGLTRMGWLDRVTEMLPVDIFTPAPGQGALAVETRNAPDEGFRLVSAIDDARIRQALEIERAFLGGVGGGCTTPIGAHAIIEMVHGQSRARFFGMLARDDGEGLTRVYEEWARDVANDRAFDLAKGLVREVHPNRVTGAGVDVPDQLRGMKIIATGSDALVADVTREVERRGGVAVHVPTIRIESPTDPEPLRDAEAGLRQGAFDRVVFTSKQAVRALVGAVPPLTTGAVRVAAIGAATADALRVHGVVPDVVAKKAQAEGLTEALRPHISPGDRILLPVSNRARTVVADALGAMGADVTRIDAYETHIISEVAPEIIALVEKGEIGAVLLASPSAVEGLVAQLGNLLPVLSGAGFVAIGSVTARAMRDHGLPVHAMPDQPGAAAMVDALGTYLWGTDDDANGAGNS